MGLIVHGFTGGLVYIALCDARHLLDKFLDAGQVFAYVYPKIVLGNHEVFLYRLKSAFFSNSVSIVGHDIRSVLNAVDVFEINFGINPPIFIGTAAFHHSQCFSLIGITLSACVLKFLRVLDFGRQWFG